LVDEEGSIGDLNPSVTVGSSGIDTDNSTTDVFDPEEMVGELNSLNEGADISEQFVEDPETDGNIELDESDLEELGVKLELLDEGLGIDDELNTSEVEELIVGLERLIEDLGTVDEEEPDPETADEEELPEDETIGVPWFGKGVSSAGSGLEEDKDDELGSDLRFNLGVKSGVGIRLDLIRT
jgi:hypothetical protein